MTDSIFMTCGARTPIGDLGGTLATVPAVQLGETASRAAMERAGIALEQIGEAIFGNVLQAGQGQNPARQVALGIGLPQSVPAYTVNMVCGSGMKAVELGIQRIKLGESSAVLTGGIESMSQAPYLLPSLRAGARLGHAQAIDSVLADGLTDVFGDYHMGLTAETLATRFGISRADQDNYALQSHRRYAAAAAELAPELVPVNCPGRKGVTVIAADQHPRPDVSLERLGTLRPAFAKTGSVTAGNASGINDGAAAVVLLASNRRPAADIPLLRVRDVVSVGCDPALMGLGPVYAVQALLKRHNMTPGDIDVWELNEAFAVQALAVLQALELDPARVNVNGGAIALGHPIGASGTRILVTLAHQMKRQSATLGVAALCIGGGMGMAMLLENC